MPTVVSKMVVWDGKPQPRNPENQTLASEREREVEVKPAGGGNETDDAMAGDEVAGDWTVAP